MGKQASQSLNAVTGALGMTRRPCPNCGSTVSSVLFVPASSPGAVERCGQCGMVFVAEIRNSKSLIFEGAVQYDYDTSILTSSNLDDVKDSWELQGLLSGKEAEAPILRQNAQAFLQKIQTYINPVVAKPKILDFGSGWGFFLSVAKEMGWDAYGLEPLPASAVYARAMFGLSIITNTLSPGLYENDYFDVITSFQVFEHLPYPSHDIEILSSILKPNGLILIEVPNFDTWTMKLMKAKHRHFVSDHLNFFSDRTLADFLARRGLEVLEIWHPTRSMSVRHMVDHWVNRFLPGLKAPAKRLAVILGLWERAVHVNVGDIVAILARKVQVQSPGNNALS